MWVAVSVVLYVVVGFSGVEGGFFVGWLIGIYLPNRAIILSEQLGHGQHQFLSVVPRKAELRLLCTNSILNYKP